jgi:hypothetical protein
MNRTTSTLVALALFTLAGCAGTQRRSEETGYRVPEASLRDPYERMMIKEQMRSQLSRKTMAVPGEQYRAEIRPQIARELSAAGFSAGDVEDILGQVDETRAAVRGDDTRTARR